MPRKLLFPVFCLLLAWSAATVGQEEDARCIAAVSDFENYSGDLRFAFMQKGIADAVINKLADLSGLMVVERQRLDQVMAELQLSQSGLMNDMTVRKVGRSLAAGLMIVGGYEYNGFTRQLRVNARVVEIETGLIVYSDTVIDDEVLADDLQKAIAEKLKGWFMVRFGFRSSAAAAAPAPETPPAVELPPVETPAVEVPEALATVATQAPPESVEEVPRPANLFELIKLLFTDMRSFPTAGRKDSAGKLPDLIKAAEQTRGEFE